MLDPRPVKKIASGNIPIKNVYVKKSSRLFFIVDRKLHVQNYDGSYRMLKLSNRNYPCLFSQ